MCLQSIKLRVYCSLKIRNINLKSHYIMASLLNKTHVKKFALDYANANRAHKFERVSAQFIEEIESQLRLVIAGRVQSHPSKGKTLMGR